jgi:hypothetical protein
MKWPAVACIWLFWLLSAGAQIQRLPSPTPLPSRPPTLPSPTPPDVNVIQQPTPTPTLNPPAVTPEASIPVVIAYGDGLETRAQITRGLMQPAGIPFDKPVTVTLFLGSGIPGTPVHVGLYDGGQIASVVAGLSNPPPNIVTDFLGNTVSISVGTDQTVRFNFQSGGPLGLYRVLLTIGSKQYLLQFYAVRPRGSTTLPPLPIAPVVPTPPP